MSKLLLILLVGVCIGLGQLCFAFFARNLAVSLGILELVEQCLRSRWLYAAIALYGVGIVCYGFLIRETTLVSANVSIIIIVIGLNCAQSVLIGEKLTMGQWLGVALAIPSIALLRG